MLLHDQKESHNAVKPALAGLYGDRVSALKPLAKVTAGRRVTLRAEVCFAQEMAQPAARLAAFCGFLVSGACVGWCAEDAAGTVWGDWLWPSQ
ncbi:hypothetical protein [Yersinia intermedia]|uniref:hypothetical protein n=1 Tax=Yersinia intermedia TaxID=631 RepID=UPI000683179B|nr:hypothetical protein [Yersinia intermedia]MDA5510724.1 hypothetical protein [Yersinia intermedia]